MSNASYDDLRLTLIYRRMTLKLRQWQVAELMGTTQSAVSDLETGRTKDPCMRTLANWAHALELELVINVRSVGDDSTEGGA